MNLGTNVDWLEEYTRGEGADLLKGVLAGAAGGLVGTLRMGALPAMIERAAGAVGLVDPDANERPTRRGEEPFGDAAQAKAERDVAGGVVQSVQARPATPRERRVGGEAAHAITGVVAGAVYGAAAEYAPALKRGYGVPLGLTLYLLGRQATLPLVQLAPPPTQQSRSDLAMGLLSHLAYGVVCEAVRGKLRRSMRA